MARITDEQRSECTKKQDVYRSQIAQIVSEETVTLDGLSLLDPVAAAQARYKLSNSMIDLASMHFHINELSIHLLDIKNEEPLVEARKAIYKSITYLEEIVTNSLNVPFSEYAESTALLSGISINSKFLLIRKIGLAIDLVAGSLNDSSKWKSNLVELQGRLAIVTKNMVDMPDLVREFFDLQSKDHPMAVHYVNMLKTLYAKSIEDYNDRFDMITHSPDDLRLAANFADTYTRILTAIADNDAVADNKKLAEFLHDKYEANAKKAMNKD